ncbi:hypothetical protein BREVNS_0042 [Brevinematales bacterium NS]|nr:hypothetical protein BREVNS_0042 [Brevinematales bacterium NS]
MALFEILMLLCFGAAWPFSIYRSYISRSTAGKSVIFLWIVWLGYIFGILNKFVRGVDGVVFFYLLNLSMVSIDIALYYRNRHIHKEE